MKIHSTSTVANTRLKILVSGFSGSGKTSSIASIKQAGYKPLVLSFEGGLLPLASHEIDYVDGTRDDKGVLIPKEKRGERLKEFFTYLSTEECKSKYDTIVLDSLTEISQCLYDGLKVQFPDRKDSLVLFGELGQRSRDVIKSFRDTDYHVVCTVLAKADKDEFGKKYISLDMIGSVSDRAPQFFDTVTYIRVASDGTREFVCQPTDQIIAKDRSSKLGKTEPSLASIFNKSLNKESSNVVQPK